ncbi:MAG: protein kinase [Anaerolineaceae bacterium]|nr:protein kinase [Anaerolineaceae bacterium]
MPETTQFAGMDGTTGGYNSLQVGTVLLARYKILGVLGGGGQGAVYQARDLNFPDVKKLVAVKEMLNPATDPSLRASTIKTFQREANILATLSHPAIPKIYDFFDWNDRAYLVMEYINGNDLEELLSKTKSLPVEKVIEWAIDLCDVLEYLHNHQPEPIIFRDMKPANVMIDNLGKVRLIDFGIAKTFQPNIKHTMIGTEGYSAPEQYKGNVTPLSDIYSLGATLHHVLTRRDPRLEPPFSFSERPIQDFNESVPPPLATVVEKAVEFESAKRFQSCLEMKQSLEELRYRPLNPAFAGNGNHIASRDGEVSKFFSGELTGQPEPRWKFKTEDEIRCNPTSYKDLAFIGSYDTNVWALKLQTGEMAWKYATNGGIASSPIIDDDSKAVLFGSEDYSFYSVDIRSGKINWSYRTEGRIRSTAQIAHGRVFFGSDDGYLYALMAATGRFLWRYDLGSEVQSSPFVTNEIIIVGSASGEVAAVDLSGGKRKWGVRAKRGVLSSPYVDLNEDICYFGSSDNHVYAVDASGGFTSWRFRTRGAIISSPIVADGMLYFGSTDGSLYAINAQTSREKWKFTTDKPIVGSPIVHRDTVYIGGTDEYLYCIDVNTGKERWKYKTNGPITSKPHIVGDILLVGSMDRTLYALPLVS